MKKTIFCTFLILSGSLSMAAQRTARAPSPSAAGNAAAAPVSVGRAGVRNTVVNNQAPRAAAPTVAARAGVRNAVVNAAPKPVGAAPAPSTGTRTVAARAAATQSVIQTGSAKVAQANTTSLVSEECKNKYFGCMDSFCMMDNTNGARCVCSDQVKNYDNILAQIEKLDAESLKLAVDGVARIEQGQTAAEVDRMVNTATDAISAKPPAEPVAAKKSSMIDIEAFNNIGVEFEAPEIETIEDPLAGLTGNALHVGVRNICIQQIDGCEKDIDMLQMMYTNLIKSDCNGYDLELKKRVKASEQKLLAAQRAMKDAALEKFHEENKFDEGQCIYEMRKCVAGPTGGCGEDFTKCTFYNTSEGLSGSSTPVLVPGSKIQVGEGTLDSIQAKRKLCESTVVKNCVAVKDRIWDAFLSDIAPALKAAELTAENSQRMNRLEDISKCFIDSCKTSMDPNDPDGSYDACLGDPAIMGENCKVVLDRAGVTISDTDETWVFVKAKLAAMRVDACTTAVKQCFTKDTACGEDYANCAGMDQQAVRDMCPVTSLVACRENGEATTFELIDQLIMGIYLQADNAAMEQCQNAIEEKMIEVCGSTVACDAAQFQNKMFGLTGLALNTTKVDEIEIMGLVDWSKVNIVRSKTTGTGLNAKTDFTMPKMAEEYCLGEYNDDGETCKTAIPAGKSAAYLSESRKNVHNVAQTVNAVIGLIADDPKVQPCIIGRNMSQIRARTNPDGTRAADQNTEARFPRMMDPFAEIIVSSGMDIAKQNYDKELKKLKDEALKRVLEVMEAADDIGGVMCYDKSVMGPLL